MVGWLLLLRLMYIVHHLSQRSAAFIMFRLHTSFLLFLFISW